MASSSSQRDTTRTPQPHDRLASFHSLIDKVVTAGVLCQHARDAELSAKAAEKGEALFGDNSLVVASLRMEESKALANLALTAPGSEDVARFRRSWSALLSVIAILQSRLADNTLLPGTVRKKEMDYFAYLLRATFDAQNKPIPSPARLQARALTVGYNVLIDALHRSLHFSAKLFVPLWPVAQRKIVESFVRALLSSRFALTHVPARACSFRCSKSWTSFLARPVYMNDDLRAKMQFLHTSNNTCHHSTTNPPFAQPCSASGALMR